MGYGSKQYYTENQGGERMPEGWNVAVPIDIRYIDTKNGPAIVIKWENEEKQIATDFLYEKDTYGSNARIASLGEIAGIDWPDDTSGDDLAEMFNASLFKVSVNIKYGKGDMAFCQEYAKTQDAPAQRPMPSTPTPSRASAPASASRKGKF